MIKPLGLTPSFQVVKATKAEDIVWDTVERVIELGMTPEAFRREVLQAWKYVLDENTKAAIEELKK